MSWIYEPWPWYVSGPLITAVMAALLFAGKNFGMSSNLRTLCSMCGAGKTCDFFYFDWRAQRWNLFVMAGAVNKLHFALAVGGLFIGDYPHIGVNAGVVEHLVGQSDDGI